MALQVLSQASNPLLTALILYSTAHALYEAGEYGRAVNNLSETIQIYSATDVADEEDASSISQSSDSIELNRASALSLLGRIQYEVKDYDSAIELCQGVLLIRRSVLGANHIDTATACYNLALVLAETGCDEFTKKSICLMGRSLQLFKAYAQTSDCGIVILSSIVHVLQTLGGIYLGIEAFPNATQCIKNALQIARDILSDYPSEPTKIIQVADLLFILARITHKRGQWQAAIGHYHEALQLERLLGNDHKEIPLILCSLGQAYQKIGDLDNTLKHQEEALCVYRGLSGDQSIFLADLLTMIGNIQIERGNIQDAMARFTESARITIQFRQAHNAANSSVSFLSSLGIDKNVQIIVIQMLQRCKSYPAAEAA